MDADNWPEVLISARKKASLAREELARKSRLSPESVAAYEQGRRKPSLRALTALVDALKLDRTEANDIRLALGYAPDRRDFGTPSLADQFTVEELQVELERLPWPAFAANELMEVVAANTSAQRLWGVDLSREFLGATERNLLRVASNPRFANHCLNWEEVVGMMVGMWKGHHRGPESLENPSPYFSQLIEDFMAGDRKYVKRFLDLWENTPPRQPKIRTHYPVVWHHDDVGQLRFIGVQSSANIYEAMGWDDWIPVDALTWEGLNALRERR